MPTPPQILRIPPPRAPHRLRLHRLPLRASEIRSTTLPDPQDPYSHRPPFLPFPITDHRRCLPPPTDTADGSSSPPDCLAVSPCYPRDAPCWSGRRLRVFHGQTLRAAVHLQPFSAAARPERNRRRAMEASTT
jgi:hypothetical protein